jgi:hypothetical protein
MGENQPPILHLKQVRKRVRKLRNNVVVEELNDDRKPDVGRLWHDNPVLLPHNGVSTLRSVGSSSEVEGKSEDFAKDRGGLKSNASK